MVVVALPAPVVLLSVVVVVLSVVVVVVVEPESFPLQAENPIAKTRPAKARCSFFINAIFTMRQKIYATHAAYRGYSSKGKFWKGLVQKNTFCFSY